MIAHEVNFDGLVGPTHSYAGLSYGNIASIQHRSMVSNPREAALQGLIKAKALTELGLKQGILPPQERPDISALRRLGFYGSEAAVLKEAARIAPELLASASSASSMWTANAATVSPSADSTDGKVHFTAANLNQKFHRSIEHETTTRILQAIFSSKSHFAHHPALMASDTLGDEGAANHTRFCRSYGEAGVQFFVYGRSALDTADTSLNPKLFPARQTREASEAIARLHSLSPERTLFAQQNSATIDGGAFHNDVISVGNQNVFFYHELAFRDEAKIIATLRERVEAVCAIPFVAIRVANSEVPLSDAVQSYLFNSQLITTAEGQMTLVAPRECEDTPTVKNYLARLLAAGATPIKAVRHFDLKQSMRNGGGPACLRLRVVLNDDEIKQTNAKALLNNVNFTVLKQWVEKHYRDRLLPQDMADVKLLTEGRTALDELTQILGLGSVYEFQR